MSTGESSAAMKPPYLPTTASLGGLPTPKVDDPICAVLLLFFIAGAATNMTILRVNMSRGHKFIISGMTFGFCMARITAITMRIVWASRPHNISIAIAANILTVAGVVLLFLINLIFTQRIVRAYRPKLGWSKPATVFFRFFMFLIPAVIIMVIPCTIDSFFTLDPHIRTMDRKVQLVATTIMALLAFLPIPIVLITLFLPPLPPHHGTVEPFGKGRLVSKVRLLLFTSVLLTLGAGFRAGVNYAPRPASDPAWYHSKPAYYCINFVIEIIVVYTYTILRFDLRFHVPNGSSTPGHYAAGGLVADSGSSSKSHESREGSEPVAQLERKPTIVDRINDESIVFGSGENPVYDDEGNIVNNNSEDGDTDANFDVEKARTWDASAQGQLRREGEGQAV